MSYAHAKGVIHRDLKPANIMVGAFGELQVMDWGFAKVLGRDEPPPGPPGTPESIIATVRTDGEGSESIAGSIMGTPAYMPPEQALGQIDEIDERADVFALGSILCEILTGEAAYVGEGSDRLIQAVRADIDGAMERIDACEADDALKGPRALLPLAYADRAPPRRRRGRRANHRLSRRRRGTCACSGDRSGRCARRGRGAARSRRPAARGRRGGTRARQGRKGTDALRPHAPPAARSR